MFRKMRLEAQQLSQEDTIKILETANNGAIAFNGSGDYPYSLPMSYVYSDGKIYFHGATEGQKHDMMLADPRVCMSVTTMDDIQPDSFTTYYRSAVVYGDMRVVEDKEEFMEAMMLTVDKYCNGNRDGGKEFMHAESGNFVVYCIDIKHMTGKRSEG